MVWTGLINGFPSRVSGPQGLKPAFLLAGSGTAKSRALPKTIYETSCSLGLAETVRGMSEQWGGRRARTVRYCAGSVYCAGFVAPLRLLSLLTDNILCEACPATWAAIARVNCKRQLRSCGDFMTTTVDLEQETNPWQAQAARFDLAAGKLNLDEGLWKVLRSP